MDMDEIYIEAKILGYEPFPGTDQLRAVVRVSEEAISRGWVLLRERCFNGRRIEERLIWAGFGPGSEGHTSWFSVDEKYVRISWL